MLGDAEVDGLDVPLDVALLVEDLAAEVALLLGDAQVGLVHVVLEQALRAEGLPADVAVEVLYLHVHALDVDVEGLLAAQVLVADGAGVFGLLLRGAVVPRRHDQAITFLCCKPVAIGNCTPGKTLTKLFVLA